MKGARRITQAERNAEFKDKPGTILLKDLKDGYRYQGTVVLGCEFWKENGRLFKRRIAYNELEIFEVHPWEHATYLELGPIADYDGELKNNP